MRALAAGLDLDAALGALSAVEVLLALALGLWCALAGGDRRGRVCIGAAVALAGSRLAADLILAPGRVSESAIWGALAALVLAGLVGALAVAARPPLVVALAALGGGALGAAHGALPGAPLAALGALLADLAAVGVGATLALVLGGPRARIAARVAASWIAAMGLLLGAWRARPALSPDAGCASCVAARLSNQWCDACAKGWVASFPIESRFLFDALDAHGHDLDRRTIECATCQQLIDSEGFCEACRLGWIGGQAYMTRLTFSFARGTPRAADELACARCRQLHGGAGWCTECGGGWAGNVWFVDADEHAVAVRELGRLTGAIEASARCDTCALVSLVDGTCPFCKIRFETGRPVGAAGG